MQVIGAVNRSRRRGRDRRLRRRRPAGRAAQALARGAAERLPPRVRLLDHGLRDRRRPRRQDGPPRPRGRGDARRRQLHDDELRARHLASCSASKLIVVLLDNRGFGCINRLQLATGGASFNNLLDTARHAVPSAIDFAAHAAADGRHRREGRRDRRARSGDAARPRQRPQLRRRHRHRPDGRPPRPAAHWWDVAVPEVSARDEVRAARKDYEAQRELQRLAD